MPCTQNCHLNANSTHCAQGKNKNLKGTENLDLEFSFVFFSGHNLLVVHTSLHSKKAMKTNFNNFYGPQPKADHLALEFFRLVVFPNVIKKKNNFNVIHTLSLLKLSHIFIFFQAISV